MTVRGVVTLAVGGKPNGCCLGSREMGKLRQRRVKVFLVGLGPGAQGRGRGCPLCPQPTQAPGPSSLATARGSARGLSCFHGSGHVNQAFIFFFSPKVQLCSPPGPGF